MNHQDEQGVGLPVEVGPGCTPRERSRSRVWTAGLACVAALACQSQSTSAPAAAAKNPEACQIDKARLRSFLEKEPDHGAAVQTRSDLPVAALGGVIGAGHTLEIEGASVILDGRALPGQDEQQLESELTARLEQMRGGSATPGVEGAPNVPLYVSVSGSMDVATFRSYAAAIPDGFDLHLVFQAPPRPPTSDQPPSEQLQLETDPVRRQTIARSGYTQLVHCQEALAAIDGVPAGAPNERWPALRAALMVALPKCSCENIDVPGLHALLLAEERGGAAALGSVPFDFVRDDRCGASFGLTPIQKVLRDIERFDERHAGNYAEETLSFEPVVTNERLLIDLCQALPGETLAALRRQGRTFFWKVPGAAHCQPWHFEPLQPGSPMGTWRRADAEQPALAVHYWQGAEEVRLYGPVPDANSKPTDQRDWGCSQEFKLSGVDEKSIELEAGGRWFFDAAACEAASEANAAFPGCISALAGAPNAASQQRSSSFGGR